MKKTIIQIITLLVVCISCKKHEDITPIVQNTNTVNPTLTKNITEIPKNGLTFKIFDLVNNNSSDTNLLFEQVPEAFKISLDRKSATLDTNLVYYGIIGTFTLTNNIKTIKVNYSGSIGTDSQIITYNLLSPMFGVSSKSSNPKNLMIYLNKIVRSTTNEGFFGNNINTISGTYSIDKNGHLFVYSSDEISDFVVSYDNTLNKIIFYKASTNLYFNIIK